MQRNSLIDAMVAARVEASGKQAMLSTTTRKLLIHPAASTHLTSAVATFYAL
jgi:hypothetical protein